MRSIITNLTNEQLNISFTKEIKMKIYKKSYNPISSMCTTTGTTPTGMHGG